MTNSAWHLAGVLLWRQWREQSRRLVWMPVGFALVLGAITVLAFSVPGVLTPLTRRALDTAMTLYFHRIHGAVALGLAFLVFQSPYFIALFASLTGSQIAQASIGGEWVRGGFELLLSAPYRPQVLYVAFLVSDLLLTIWGFVWLAAVSLGVSLGGVSRDGRPPGEFAAAIFCDGLSIAVTDCAVRQFDCTDVNVHVSQVGADTRRRHG